MSRLKDFADLLRQSVEGVLGTITNETVTFTPSGEEAYGPGTLAGRVETPFLLMSAAFEGDQSFSMQLVFPTAAVALLADLMMMGDGSVAYNPDEHNDAAQEMLNQVLGSLNADLAGQGKTLSGTITSVDLMEMDSADPVLSGSQVVMATLAVKDNNYPLTLFFDQTAQGSLEALLGGAAKPEPEQPQPEITRANLAQVHETRSQFNYSSINVDLLMDIVLPITVELGRKNMRIKDILEMGQGSVLELDKLAGDFVDILVNGQKFALGEIMVVDDNFAIRIVNLISREDRIKSLGR